ncbi:MAG TPA: DUF2089 domain-containing protein [Ktedonobacterales bacterium]
MRTVGGVGGGAPLLPLITRDPVSGGELVVTRLESPQSGLVIEGAFSLGWIGRLTPEQLEFVGRLVRSRGNVQKVAADLNIAYNTARNRLDDIVAALEAPERDTRGDQEEQERRTAVLRRLSRGEIEFDEALLLLEQ